ncbi:MAG: glycosyltransferase family A protein [Patescibacteria group bacterium]
MTISVVIPARNEEKYIRACLESILLNQTSDVIEVILVDNGSTDNTAEVAKYFAEVRVVYEAQKGITRARQRGLLEAKGELLAFLDADTLVTPKWFQTVSAEFASHPDMVCLSGPFDYYDLPVFKRALTKFFQVLLYPLVNKITGFLTQGGNFVVKKSALLKIGGFDKNIEFYGEDTDISIRLHRVGKVKYTKELLILTSGRRLQSEGVVRTGLRYCMNFIWEAAFKRPYSKSHKDIR